MKLLLISFLFIVFINFNFANDVIKQLDERIFQTNSLVCVGLDPDLGKLPLPYKEDIFLFLSEIIDITSPHVCAYKIQKAFFDRFANGYSLCREICSYIHINYPAIPIFIDCKIGDVGNTMQSYMALIFDDMKADGVVVNPYMGDDIFAPFLEDSNKVAIVLIQTSNPNAKVVQELPLANGKVLWEEILDIAVSRWNTNKNIIPVLSSKSGSDYNLVRKKIPQDMPILLVGIGAQEGNPQVLGQLLNKDKRGVFVNSSRGILYPYTPEDENWRTEVLRAVIRLKETLNRFRE